MKTTRNNIQPPRWASTLHYDRMRDAERKDVPEKENPWQVSHNFYNEKENRKDGKSKHVENLEEDVYRHHEYEDDVKAEFKIRNESGMGSNGRGNKYMDENQRWRMYDSGTKSDEHTGGNEHRESGTDETIGVP